MSEEIRSLEPVEVWRNFADLNAVPRPSKKEERVIEFMLSFGERLGLETFKDDVGNVIIRKPASRGMEDRKTVVLQSHLDMVHQKNRETDFDFENQGIEMFVDGGWVRAKGTTLGADNGLGVAAIMALLESNTIDHPPLEALFTIDEETGMTGAKGLVGGLLQGGILLNLDTEEDDEIDIGCAGGIDISAIRGYKQVPMPPKAKAYKLSLKGLQGGHSGMDIHRGFGNANKLMNRLLYQLNEEVEIGIASLDGGGLRNAIPRESMAVILIPAQDEKSLQENLKVLTSIISKEFSVTEPDLVIEMSEVESAGQMMETEDKNTLLRTVYGIHNGVYAMSASIPDLVETSNNLARVTVREGEINIHCLTRSSVDTAKTDLANALKSTLELGGFKVKLSGEYPGWKPNPESEILRVLTSRYSNLFGEEPKVVACHAGLECGILGQHYPDLDMISFGPTIKGAHSPDERAEILSVQKFWKFLLDILRHIPAA